MGAPRRGAGLTSAAEPEVLEAGVERLRAAWEDYRAAGTRRAVAAVAMV